MKIKRDAIYIFVILGLAALSAWLCYTSRYLPTHDISVYYNHDRALNLEVINIIRDADKFVYFSIYTFTKQDIKDALLAAKYRHLTVVGLTDRDQTANSDLQKKIISELRDSGIPVFEQDHQGIMHTKVVVTEKAYASGSYNWTGSATDINDEILEVGHDETIRGQYQKILEKLFEKYGSWHPN